MPNVSPSILSTLLGTALLLGGCASSRNAAVQRQPVALPSAQPVQAMAPAQPVATNVAKAPLTLPVPLVKLAGSPQELGVAHGQALSSTIRVLQEKYLHVFINNDAQLAAGRLAAGVFGSYMLPAHREEVMALSKGSGVDGPDIMLTQCFLDLTPITACSTVALPASASPDGVARLGRTLDFPSLGVADKFTTLFVVKPQGRFAFASIGWPGMIGVLSGMNEHGLTLSNMEVTRGMRMPSAMPYTLLYRTILEQCRTVDEAIAFLERTPRQTPNNLMLMDAAGNRAVAEITPERVVVRRADGQSALMSTNHQRGASTPAGATGQCSRYDYMYKQTTRDFGGIDATGVESMLRHVGNTMTLQAMVFEPSTRVIHLAAGTNAADRTFTRVELRSMFE